MSKFIACNLLQLYTKIEATKHDKRNKTGMKKGDWLTNSAFNVKQEQEQEQEQ